MKGGLNNIMRKAQQMQSKISEIQEKIGEEEFEASTGGGVVTATVNGDQEVLGVDIDPEVMDPEDTEMVELARKLTEAINKSGQKTTTLEDGANVTTGTTPVTPSE